MLQQRGNVSKRVRVCEGRVGETLKKGLRFGARRDFGVFLFERVVDSFAAPAVVSAAAQSNKRVFILDLQLRCCCCFHFVQINNNAAAAAAPCCGLGRGVYVHLSSHAPPQNLFCCFLLLLAFPQLLLGFSVPQNPPKAQTQARLNPKPSNSNPKPSQPASGASRCLQTLNPHGSYKP